MLPLLIVALAIVVPGTAHAELDLETTRQHIIAGRYAKARARLEPPLEEQGAEAGPEAACMLVRVYHETGAYQLAVTLAERLQQHHAENPDWAVWSATTLVDVGNVEAAGQLLRKAFDRHPNHVGIRLALCDLARLTGDRRTIDEQAGFFFDLYASGRRLDAKTLTAIAESVREEDPRGAWRAFNEAHRADPKHLEGYVRAGRHCLDVFAWQFARNEFDTALKINPHHAESHAGLALLHLQAGDYAAAQAAAEKALGSNPNLCAAHEVKAAVLAVEESADASLDAIQAALKVNPKRLPALALLAAHHENAGNAAARDSAIAAVLKTNPRYAGLYTTLCQTAERSRRFPQATAWAREAVRHAPDDWQGYYFAGMNLLRLGEETEGYRLLNQAFERNEFNVWAYNMLHVLDKDLRRRELVHHHTEHFTVKIHHRDAPFLWPPLQAMLEPLYELLTTKYAVTPTGPREFNGRILLLILESHDDFSSRTVGLPGLGAMGASFGQVVTMPSPRFGTVMRAARGDWLQVVAHEFAHVIALQKTQCRVPRWLTEGISVLEENATHVDWDPLLVSGVMREMLLPVEELSSGFTRPRFPQQLPLSYCQAYLTVQFIRETCGETALARLLECYAAGQETEQAIPTVTGLALPEFNRAADDSIKAYAQSLRPGLLLPADLQPLLAARTQTPDADAQTWSDFAETCLSAKMLDEAAEAAKHAAKLDPALARPHALLGIIASRGRGPEHFPKEHFLKAKALSANEFFARLHLARIADEAGDVDQAIAEFEAARRLGPRYRDEKNDPHLRLAELYFEKGSPDKAAAVLEALVQADSDNQQGWHNLARLLLRHLGSPEHAIEAFARALAIGPYDLEARLGAGAAYAEVGDAARAEHEYRLATLLRSRSLPALLGHAGSLAALGRFKEALDVVQKARRVDPESPDVADLERALRAEMRGKR